MSTAAVSSLSILQELQNFYQTRQSDLKQLGGALQSGDLNAAQQAFTALEQLGQSGPFSSSEPFSKSSRAQAFEALGQALQSGDLEGAKSAFAALALRPTDSAPPPSPAAIVNLSNSQPASATSTSGTPNSASIYQQLQAYQHQRRGDLAQLGQALQAGNLADAQTAFDALVVLGQNGPYKSGATFAAPNREQDFQAIGQALQEGNLPLAQSAFSALSSTFGHENQHAQNAINIYNGSAAEIIINVGGASSGTPVSGSQPELVINLGQGSNSGASVTEIDIHLGAAPSSAPAPEIIINLGQQSASGSGEQITINPGNATVGTEISIGISPASGTSQSNHELVTLNFNQNNLNQNQNVELILNFLNSTTSQSQTALGSGVSLHA